MNPKRAFLIILLILCSGCLNFKQPANKISYYSLEYSPPIQHSENGSQNSAPLPFVIQVERFQTAPFYDSNKIVYREDEFKRDAYIYHKWLSNPGEMVSYFLARDMRESGLFKAVFSPDTGRASSYIVQGSADEFFELDEKDSWYAVLSLSITLMAADEPDISKKILLQKQYSTKERCQEKNPAALAASMSRAMSKNSEKIITDIYRRLGQ
jgi:cholesterol transport system auxiliary component